MTDIAVSKGYPSSTGTVTLQPLVFAASGVELEPSGSAVGPVSVTTGRLATTVTRPSGDDDWFLQVTEVFDSVTTIYQVHVLGGLLAVDLAQAARSSWPRADEGAGEVAEHTHGYGDLTGTIPPSEKPLPVDLTDAATINTDAALGDHFRVTLGGNRTLANPTNPRDGQKILFEITQDATGGRTLALGSNFNLAGQTVTLSTTPSKRDYLGFVYHSAAGKWDLLAQVIGA